MPVQLQEAVPLHVVVLAAGQGTRMRSELPKVLHRLAGLPLLAHVLKAVAELAPAQTHVVYGADAVRAAGAEIAVNWVPQTQQLGTGHALQQALPQIDDDARILVVYGDIPLITPPSLTALLDPAEGLVLLTAELDDPAGYGRILRDDDGAVRGIVEQRDASAGQLAITEINTGFLSAPARLLRQWLGRLDRDNDQGEYYLTDVVALAVADGVPVSSCRANDPWEVSGVNSRRELAALERHYQHRQAQTLMAAGVTVMDPARIDVRGWDVVVGRDCVLDVNVVLTGPCHLGEGVHVGANSCLQGVEIGDGVVVESHCVIQDAVIGARSVVGPFARIRPGARLAAGVHVGNFVEVKNSYLAPGAKANHLSYVGDSDVGAGVNVGAGVITCNYDGAYKHRTVIGDDVFIGSNSQLVAPVTIDKGATIGAGSTITADVPPEVLAVTRAEQRHISDWRRPRKPKP